MPAPSLSHVLLSVPIFGLGYGAALLGPHWAGALAVILYWLGRELAQSWRPSTMRFVWSWTSTRNLAQPAAAALLIAGVIEVLTSPAVAEWAFRSLAR